MLRPLRNERFRSSPQESEVGFETALAPLGLRTFLFPFVPRPFLKTEPSFNADRPRSAQIETVAALVSMVSPLVQHTALLVRKQFLRLRLFAVMLLPCLLTSTRPVQAQEQLEQEAQIRLGAKFKKKFNKQWSVGFGPELRLKNFDPDRYLFEVGARYKPTKYFDLNAELRGDLNETKDGLGYGARPAFSLSGALPFSDFKPELRILYTYDFGYLRQSEHRLRYQGSLKYDVPKVRLDIKIAAEAFHRLDDLTLFKMRYGLDLDYKFYKSKTFGQFVYGGYALDYYLDERLNVHIAELGYKFEF